MTTDARILHFTPPGYAPYPPTPGALVAVRLAKHLTAKLAWRLDEMAAAVIRLALSSFDTGGSNPRLGHEYAQHVPAASAEFGMLYALRALADVDPERADRVAAELVKYWDDAAADSLEVVVRRWATEAGLPGPQHPVPKRPKRS